MEKKIDGFDVKITLGDTAAQEVCKKKYLKKKDYDRIRPLCYPQTDVFLILFSLVDVKSVNNITEKWIPEIFKNVGCVKFIFVGNKSDLLENEAEMRKIRENGFDLEEMKNCIHHLKEKYPNTPYIETSCLTQTNLEEALILGYREALKGNEIQKKKDGCIIH
jgi:small GTP-binding protein